jgi:hypothetical protein
MRALELDTHVAAPPAFEEMHMRIIGQRLRDELVRRTVRRDRPADELVATIGEFGSSKSRRRSLAKNEWISPLKTTGFDTCVSWMRLRRRARLAG